MWDLERGEIPAAWPADVAAWCIRADGRQVAVVRADGELRVYDLPAMTEAARLRLGFVTHERVADQRDGSLRRWSTLRHHARRRGEPSGSTTWRAATWFTSCRSRPRGSLGALALDHAGALLAVEHAQAILTYDVTSGEVLARLQGHEDSRA